MRIPPIGTPYPIPRRKGREKGIGGDETAGPRRKGRNDVQEVRRLVRRILVTGGAGYIGSVTVARLLEAGERVTVFDDLSTGHRRAIPPGADFVEGSLADRAALEALCRRERFDAVMHLAGHCLVAESIRYPERYFENNVSNGLNLLEAMRRNGIPRIVFSSTCAIFGQPAVERISEETPQAPVNPYGESKWIFERILRWYSEAHALCAVSLRYFNAAGATERFGEDHRPETHLIPILLEVALGQRRAVEIFGTDYPTPDGTCIRDYIHVRDIAEAHLLALSEELSGFEAFNLGNGSGSSVREVVEATRVVTGREIPVTEGARRPGDPARLVGDPTRIGERLGWKPAIPALEEIIESAWRWKRSHPEGYDGG
ncbi:MAG: UDP-glucose 4-epimerase GalE [Deltaproteobacteria bacterium]|nr:MAG: UDP-glucose 4-epimerase GalE [Deltaproteobacteria bacterium]